MARSSEAGNRSERPGGVERPAPVVLAGDERVVLRPGIHPQPRLGGVVAVVTVDQVVDLVEAPALELGLPRLREAPAVAALRGERRPGLGEPALVLGGHLRDRPQAHHVREAARPAPTGRSPPQAGSCAGAGEAAGPACPRHARPPAASRARSAPAASRPRRHPASGSARARRASCLKYSRGGVVHAARWLPAAPQAVEPGAPARAGDGRAGSGSGCAAGGGSPASGSDGACGSISPLSPPRRARRRSKSPRSAALISLLWLCSFTRPRSASRGRVLPPGSIYDGCSAGLCERHVSAARPPSASVGTIVRNR